MSTIAFPMVVLWLTGSPVEAGWTAFAATAPSILVYMPAGALVDLWQPRRVMLVSEFGRGVAIAAVALSLLLHRANIPLLIGAAVVEEILEVFSTLAERRYVSSVVGHEQASAALVRMEARTHVMVLAGRPCGGLLFALAPTLPFAADTLSFFISVSAIIKIKSGQVSELIEGVRLRRQKRGAANYCRLVSREKLWRDIRDGWHWLRHDKFARTTVALSAGTTLICQALIMIFLAYAHSQKLASVLIGVALAASGLGGALGSVIASRLPKPTSRSWTVIRICAWLMSVAVLAMPEGRSFLCMAFVMAALGFTGALGNVELGTYLIQNAPEEMLARVTSIGRLMSFGACAVGPVVGGVVIQEYKIRHAVLLLAVAVLAMSVFSLLLPARTGESRIRKLSRPTISFFSRPGRWVLSGSAALANLTVSGIRVWVKICAVLAVSVIVGSCGAVKEKHRLRAEASLSLSEGGHLEAVARLATFPAEPVTDSSALVS